MKNLLFDLDGTLVDSAEGILSSVRKALTDMHSDIPDEKKLLTFIGPPLIESFTELFDSDREKAEEAVKLFRKHYSSEDCLKCTPYYGITTALDELEKVGFRLFVATSKPEMFALRILEKFDMYRYFTDIAGSDAENTRSKKAEVISYLMVKHSLCHGETVMIGDKLQDLAGAAACGISGIGVSYGFGTINELESHPHIAIVDSPLALTAFLKQR